MAIDIGEVIRNIEEIAPLEYAESWDRCGLQTGAGRALPGSPERRVERILCALEITSPVIEEAAEKNVDFILVHHPFFERYGRYSERLGALGIAVYAAHTSFDSAPGGNNDRLAELLGLTNIREFETPGLIGRRGELAEEMKISEFCERIKKILELSEGELRLAGKGSMLERKIRAVGLCTGAGADMAEKAAKEGCDFFVTGDMKYHAAQRFVEEGLAVADAGHYGTEKIFAANMAKRLSERLGGSVVIYVSEKERSPFLYL